MSLIRTTRRSGLTLIVFGLIGAAFFWITDPRLGPAVQRSYGVYDPRRLLALMRGNPAHPIDAANDASVATFVGLAGSLVVLGIGLYLMSRRKL